MEYYMIEVGDMFVFNFIVEVSFLVKVYDKCGIEKVFLMKDFLMDVELVLLLKMLYRLDLKYRFSLKEFWFEEDVEDSDEEVVGEGSDEVVVDCM